MKLKEQDCETKGLVLMSYNIDFQYKYTTGDTWASGFIATDKNKFEFVCSYLFNNPLEELLNAVYQIVVTVK